MSLVARKYLQAILGDVIEVETVDGPEKLEIPKDVLSSIKDSTISGYC